MALLRKATGGLDLVWKLTVELSLRCSDGKNLCFTFERHVTDGHLLTCYEML